MKYENVTMKGNANEFRFSLTKEGDRKLVVFGVNPSTANEQIADLTVIVFTTDYYSIFYR